MNSADLVDDKDSQQDMHLNFPDSVVSSLEEVLPNAEQFDNPEFNTVSYINSLFPTEQSLCNMEAVAARCEFRLGSVQEDIQRLVRGAAGGRRAGAGALQAATQEISRLSEQVLEINKKAERSELMVREITAEIKQLDAAKSNLTAAITALNHYHMLVGGAAALTRLTTERHYREIVLPLQACTEVLQHFEHYRDIRQISELRDDVTRIRATLGQQILADFKEAFSGSKCDITSRTLADACLVVDALDQRVKKDLVKWLVNLELQEYVHLFSPGEQAAWLDRVERRYAWLKRHLLAFERIRAKIFPPAWDLSQHIARHFCKVTHDELTALMASRQADIDVKLLLYAIQKTYNFELLLHKRFEGGVVEAAGGVVEAAGSGGEEGHAHIQDGRPEPQVSKVAGIESDWIGAIGGCFERYLSLYITSLRQNLRQLMDTFVQKTKRGPAASAECGAEGGVLSSCADLFVFYKKCLVQCAQLSTGEPMRELASLFAEYLREYASGVLQASIPRAGSTTATTALVSNLSSLLRDDTLSRYNEAEVARITSVIATADYCLETTVHLQSKLREKISPELREHVDLTPERDMFHKIIEDCIQLLVQDLMLACTPALVSMSRASWSGARAVGDHSPHVTQLTAELRRAAPVLRDRLASCRKYFTQLCIRFANRLIPAYVQHVYDCKPMSAAGAEQMLLDAHVVKSCLLRLPSESRPAPAAYTCVVLRLMSRLEMLLKLVMAPHAGEGELAQQVARLLPGAGEGELRRALDMKGIRVSRAQLAELERACSVGQ